jgi:hypothetical protein
MADGCLQMIYSMKTDSYTSLISLSKKNSLPKTSGEKFFLDE